MSDSHSATPPEVMTFKNIIAHLRSHWRTFLICVASFLALAILYLVITPSKYTSTMTLVPQLDGLNQSRGSYTDVSSLMLGSSQGPESFRRFELLLTSDATAERMQEKHHVLQKLFPNRWDAKHKRWKHHMSPGTLVRFLLGHSKPDTLDAADLARYIKRSVKVAKLPENRTARTLKYTARDPKFAAEFLGWLFEATDYCLKKKEAREAKRAAEYLQDHLTKVNVTEYRQALSQALLYQQKKLMFLQSDGSYGAVALDGPTMSLTPSSPRVGMTLVVAILAGLILGILLSLPRKRRD